MMSGGKQATTLREKKTPEGGFHKKGKTLAWKWERAGGAIKVTLCETTKKVKVQERGKGKTKGGEGVVKWKPLYYSNNNKTEKG